MKNNIFDFHLRALLRDITTTQSTQRVHKVADNVALLVHPKIKYHIYTERLRTHLDIGAEIFFEKMVSLGKVTVVNPTSKIDFNSSLHVELDSGEIFTFPVDGFLRLTVPNPALITGENIDRILLEVLESFQIRIGMRQDDYEYIDGLFLQDEINDANVHLFFPEKSPIILDINHPDDNVYSCFFSESTHYIASITPDYFVNPAQVTVLELMCLARNDFLEEGNLLKENAFMELEFCTRNDIKITKIPLLLLEHILSDSIARKSPILANYSPEIRIQKYCFLKVFPMINALLYEDDDE